MRRHRPSVGASSIAPFSLMHSACTPRAAKWRRVTCGYLVATRIWLQRLGSSLSASVHRLGYRQPAARRCRGRAARRSRDSRTPSARRCRRCRAGPRRRRRRWRRRTTAPGSPGSCGWLVAKRRPRCRGSSKAGSGSSPACAISGRSSSRAALGQADGQRIGNGHGAGFRGNGRHHSRKRSRETRRGRDLPMREGEGRCPCPALPGSTLEGTADQGLGLVLHLPQVGLAAEALGVDLVDLLGARGPGREPAVLGRP